MKYHKFLICIFFQEINSNSNYFPCVSVLQLCNECGDQGYESNQEAVQIYHFCVYLEILKI